MRLFLLVLIMNLSTVLFGQDLNISVKKAADELKEFVALPNFGLKPTDINKNIEWLDSKFKARGFQTEILETKGNPLFLGTFESDTKLPTVLFYMHLDGQAVDPGKWDQPDPYQMILKSKNDDGQWEKIEWERLAETVDSDWRLFGRSASDDKGPIIAFLQAIDLLKTTKTKPKFNIKVVLDGEEEIGSKSLAGAVKIYREKLLADVLIINDGPVHISGRPTLTFGCRGITTINLTTYGPVKPQHSGHYGNYAPNPVFRMAHLLASMKDDEGRVIVPGYYDGIELDDEVKKILAAVPDDESAIQDLLQIAESEKVGGNYQESLQYPSLNARGISSAWVGAQARTIVPDNATVAIDIRLVPESDPNKLVAALRKHIEAQGFHIVDHEPTYEERKKYPKLIYFYHNKNTYPFRTDMNAPAGKWLERSIVNTFDESPVKIRIMGGTVPIAAFINELKIPAIIVPMVNPDNNQHSPNENFRVGHFVDAIKLFYGIFNTPMN